MEQSSGRGISFLILVGLIGFGLFWMARWIAVPAQTHPGALADSGHDARHAVSGDTGPTRTRAQQSGERTVVTSAPDLLRTPDAGAASRGTQRAPETHFEFVGRAVDSSGRPVSGAAVTVSLANLSGHRVGEASSVTREDGRFELTLPTSDGELSADMGSLELRPASPFLSIVRRRFDQRSGSSALARGRNDLGDLVLAPAGVLEGTVRTSDGRSPEGASTRIMDPRVRSSGAEIGPDGQLFLPHLPPLVEELRTRLAGYADSLLGPVEVRANQRTVIEIVLERADGLAGRILGTGGRAVEGAQVSAVPVELQSGKMQGRHYTTASGPNGRFALEPGVGESFRIDVRAPGYHPLVGHEQSRARVFERGTREIELALQALEERAFRIVDAATGAPIEHFGIVVVERAWASGSHEPTLGQHPEGLFRARAGSEHDLLVSAPGYADRTFVVEDLSPSATPTAVPMTRASRVRGRIVTSSAPLAGATIELQRTYSRELLQEQGLDPATLDLSNHDRFADRKRAVTSDAQGEFALEGLPGNTWRLDVRAPEDSPATAEAPGEPLLGERRVFLVAAARELDLGEIELGPGNRLEGRVLTRPGTSPAGLSVSARSGATRHQTRVTAEGTYEFDSLPQGTNQLWIDAMPGITAVDRTWDVEVHEAGVTHFDLDLTALAPTTLEVVVTENGRGVGDLIIEVRAADETWKVRLPRTDQAGRTAGTCPTAVDVIVTATTPAISSAVVCAAARADLLPSAPNRVELEITPTSVELVFPAP